MMNNNVNKLLITSTFFIDFFKNWHAGAEIVFTFFFNIYSVFLTKKKSFKMKKKK